MRKLIYQVKETEVGTAKWYWKVLQPRAGVKSTNDSYRMFTYYCRKLRKKFKENEIDINEFNNLLFDVVREVTKEYPEDFNEDKLGWWSNEEIVKLIKEGKVSIEGEKVRKEG